MQRWAAKLLALFGTFFLPLFCTLLPYKLSGYITRRGSAGKRTLSYLMCFGGGIFFGTYLLHMGPEVQKILRESLLEPNHIDYPIAELIVGVGFFIVLYAEKVVLRWNKNRIARKRRRSCPKEAGIVDDALRPVGTPPRDMPGVSVIGGESDSLMLTVADHHCSNPENLCVECLAGRPCSGFTKEEL